MLSDPTQSESREVEFVVVPPDKPVRRGRPLRLTLKRFVAICKLVEAGASVTSACEAQAVLTRFSDFGARSPYGLRNAARKLCGSAMQCELNGHSRVFWLGA